MRNIHQITRLSLIIQENVVDALDDANSTLNSFTKFGAVDLVEFAIKGVQAFESVINSVIDFRVGVINAWREITNFVKFWEEAKTLLEENHVNFDETIAY